LSTGSSAEGTEPGDLRQRHAPPVAGGQRQVAEARERGPLAVDGAGDHVDGTQVLAHLGDRDAAQQRLQLVGGVLRRQPDQP
jgi:hypothetical protein